MPTIDDAIAYVRKGKSIFPAGKDKRPLIASWKEYQNRLPTEDEILEWWTRWENANIALVTGKVSGVTVVDVDVIHGGTAEGLPITTIVKTGNGGWHYYYQYQEGIPNASNVRQGVDIRGEGGYVIAPPSVTDYEKDGKKMGGSYEWSVTEEMAEFPKDLFKAELKKETIDWKKIARGVGEGGRNDSAAKVAGKLIGKYVGEDREVFAWLMLLAWNKQNTPPLPEDELRIVFDSIGKRQSKGEDVEGEEVKIVHLSQAAALQGKDTVETTGFGMLDSVLGGGISRGSSVVVAASAGEGKTAFMQTMSYHYAKRAVCSLWFSYEETISAIWERFQKMGMDEHHQLFCPLDLEDNKLNFIEKVIAQEKKRRDFFVVFVDQLSYLSPKMTESINVNHLQQNHSLLLGIISQQLKDIAMAYGIIIVFAHQLNRGGDLAYSDMIRHAPDKVLYLKREEDTSIQKQDKFTDKTFLHVNKNRPHGTRPIVPMTVRDMLFVPYLSYLSPESAAEILGGRVIEQKSIFD